VDFRAREAPEEPFCRLPELRPNVKNHRPFGFPQESTHVLKWVHADVRHSRYFIPKKAKAFLCYGFHLEVHPGLFRYVIVQAAPWFTTSELRFERTILLRSLLSVETDADPKIP
jgi:hypothetical protein